MSEDPQPEGYTRDQLVHFLASRLREEPTPSLQALRDEGAREGFIVRRRDYDEAMRLAGPGAGPPAAPESLAEIHAKIVADPEALRSPEVPDPIPDAHPDGAATEPARVPRVVEPTRAIAPPAKSKKPLTRRQWMEAAIAAVAPVPAAPQAAAPGARGPNPGASASAGRRRGPKSVDVAGLAALLGDYENIVDERDRLRDALEAIKRALKSATGRG